MGGLLASLVGIVAVSNDKNQVKNYARIIMINTKLLILSTFTTFLFELLYFTNNESFSETIFIHSLLMFASSLLFMCFWSFFGYGLLLTFKKKWLAMIISLGIQLLELYYIFPLNAQIEQYLPTALSREIVIRNFPFWDVNSWASVKNTIVYANTSIILDSEHLPIPISNISIFLMLLWYLSMAYVVPVVSFILDKKFYKKGFFK